MANTIKIKNSSVSARVPSTGDLVESELAINTLDEKIYTKNSAGAIVELKGNSADKLPLSGGALTGALTTNSTIDGRDVAADGVLATNALPKSGGTMTGNTTHADGVKSVYGDSSDLEISHDGSNSIIKENGTGSLTLQQLLLCQKLVVQ